MLVLNLGHNPLYRHFYKCLYIEFYIFLRHDITKANFVLFIWLDGNAVKKIARFLSISYILSTSTSTILLRVSLDKKGCTSAIQASLIAFGLHFLCTIYRIYYKVLYYVNRTVQWRCPSALSPSGTGNRKFQYFFSVQQSESKLSLCSLIEKVPNLRCCT